MALDRWFLVASAFALSGAALAQLADDIPYRNVTAAELPHLLKPGTIILDVSGAGELAPDAFEAHGLHCAGCERIRSAYEFDRGFQHLKLPRPEQLSSRNLIVICRAGVRSDAAARVLAKRGYSPLNLSGGVTALPRTAPERAVISRGQ